MALIVPYRPRKFHTTLSESEIQTVVRKYAHIGQWEGLLISSKPYFGELSHGYFEVRECGRFKRYSMKPILYTYLRTQDQGHEVMLVIKPHGVILTLAALLIGSCVYFLLLHLLNFFSTFNVAPVLLFMFIVTLMSGFFVLPFQVAAERTLQFWKRELLLHDDAA
jgi:hypothetical protein